MCPVTYNTPDGKDIDGGSGQTGTAELVGTVSGYPDGITSQIKVEVAVAFSEPGEATAEITVKDET